ncbi:hypothetical protein Btru_049483 [Bulinus truncatus]|nr:hypothetical protein Btru_049483 [Bulinus truncatus]
MQIFESLGNKWHFMNVIACLVFVKYQSLVHADDLTCNDAPPTKVRGRNELDEYNRPLVQLHFTQHNRHDGLIGQEEYKVHVSSRNPLKIDISSVKIITETQDDCGIGSFRYEQKDFTLSKGDNCPTVLDSNVLESSTELPPLIWSPPSCGCVQFRVIVTGNNNAYFMDDDVAVDGPLSQTVCIEKRLTRNHYLEALCTAIKHTTAQNVVSSPSFLSRHRLDPKTMDRYNLVMDLEFRRTHNWECCRKAKLEDRVECMDDNRRRRIDSFCAYSNVDIPFVTFRVAHMREREKSCCHHLGEHRYKCFRDRSDITREVDATFLDFSMDDTDPANDLATFASSKDTETVNILRSVKFLTRSDKVDPADDQRVNNLSTEDADGGLSKKQAIKTAVSNSNSNSAERLATARRKSTKTASGEKGVGSLNRDSGEKKPKNRGSAERKQDGSERKPKSHSVTDKMLSDANAEGAAEKKGAVRSSEDRKEPTVDKFGSKERKKQGRTSTERKGVLLDNADEGYEKDELEVESSAEKTIKKIQLQIQKLKLKSQCCEAGERSGSSVVSRTSQQAKAECEHSADKYIRRIRLEDGVKMCNKNFLACCSETSISLKLTSSEFKKVYLDDYDDQKQDIVPQSDQAPEDNAEEEEEDQVEELNGPQTFDAADNERNSFDDFDRTELTPDNKMDGDLESLDDRVLDKDVLGEKDDDPLYKQSISRTNNKKKSNIKDLYRSPQNKARNSVNAKKSKAAGRTGGSSKRVKNSRERDTGRARKSSGERRQGTTYYDDQSFKGKGQGAALDSGEMKTLRLKTLKKTMDSKEMSVYLRKEVEGGQLDIQGGKSRKSRRHLKG